MCALWIQTNDGIPNIHRYKNVKSTPSRTVFVFHCGEEEEDDEQYADAINKKEFSSHMFCEDCLYEEIAEIGNNRERNILRLLNI